MRSRRARFLMLDKIRWILLPCFPPSKPSPGHDEGQNEESQCRKSEKLCVRGPGQILQYIPTLLDYAFESGPYFRFPYELVTRIV
jgi:hypothetical protein